MKWLVAFYSRTGTTKKVAEPLSGLVKSDMEEIFDTKNSMGILRFLRLGMDAAFERTTVIMETEKDAAAYDGIVVGTPIWASKMSSAAGTYILHTKGRFKKAVFCTCGGPRARRNAQTHDRTIRPIHACSA